MIGERARGVRPVRYEDFVGVLRPIEKHRAFAFIQFNCIQEGSKWDSITHCGEFWNKPRLRVSLEVASCQDRLYFERGAKGFTYGGMLDPAFFPHWAIGKMFLLVGVPTDQSYAEQLSNFR